MATPNNCAMQLLSVPHTVQRIHLPASVLLLVGPSAFSSSHQSPAPVTGAPEKRLLLPPTARRIISSPNKRTKKVSATKDDSLPKKKRGRPRRDASAAVTCSSLTPRPILPRVAGVVGVIALAGQRLEKLPYMAAKNCSNILPPITTVNCSTTSVSISNNQSTSSSSHSSTSQKSFISLPRFKTTRHISASLSQFNPGEGRSDCFSSLPHNSANDNSQDESRTMQKIYGNGYMKITATTANSFGSATTNLSSENKSRNGLDVAKLAMAQIQGDILPQLEMCKINSKRPLPISSDSGTYHNITALADRYQNDGFIETERHKPLVMRSSSLSQPAQKLDSGQTFSIIRISTRPRSPSSAISETTSLTSLTDVPSIVGHCMTASSLVPSSLTSLTNVPSIVGHCMTASSSVPSSLTSLTNVPSIVGHCMTASSSVPSSLTSLTSVPSIVGHCITASSSVPSSLTSLTNVPSTVGHCITASSSVTTQSLPLILDRCNYYKQTDQATTSKGSVLEGHDLHPKKKMGNTKPTFSSFGIEHDEPLDASIVLRLNERLNTGSAYLASPYETDVERHGFGKTLPQKIVYGSKTNQFNVNGSEEARDERVPTTDVKRANKTFLCQVCGKLLNGRSNLKSHLLTHSSTRPHVCHVCGKAFCRRHTFHIHMRTHTNENPYTCSRCPAAFKTRSNLVRHEVVHTTRSRDYRCQECGKEFTSKHSLNSHRKIHAATGPCVCSQCGETYTTMQSLRTHQLHHKYPDKRFKCKLCDKAYVFQSLLKRHMDGHIGVQKFHCHLCSATFAWKSSLAAHILTHYPKKYKCTLCSLSFNTEKRLMSHLKKHSDPNPHSCTLCLKRYPFRYLLIRHVKSAHGHKSFVTVKAKALPRKADIVRRIRNPASGASKGDDPRTASKELVPTPSTIEICAEQYPGNTDSLTAVTSSPKSTKQLLFSAVSQKIPTYKFRCVSAKSEAVSASGPRFTVSIGQKSECTVVTQSNVVKQGLKYEPVVCYPAQGTIRVAESFTVSSPADACSDGDGGHQKPPPTPSSISYRKPPPSYYSASPRGMEAFVEGTSYSPTSFRHSSNAGSKLQFEHESRSISSCAHESYTPSYETFSSSKTYNDLLSPPGLGRYQRSGGPPHPNLLPASSDPYLQAASSAHSACFLSPPQHQAYDSPSSRHSSACGSTHHASSNMPPHLQPRYGSSSPSQQSHGGLYLATHSDYDLAGCLDDDALPDGELSSRLDVPSQMTF